MKKILQPFLDFPFFFRRIKERVQVAVKPTRLKSTRTTALEYFLLSLSPSVIEGRLGERLNRMLDKYRARKAKWDRRSEQVRVIRYIPQQSTINNPGTTTFQT